MKTYLKSIIESAHYENGFPESVYNDHTRDPKLVAVVDR